ncbi:MAG TPA: Gfo/Idh/MocA family oxidoreductase [Anaerolineales bacterium]
MADSILRWGFLSTARINRDLIPPLQASKRNKLTAVASRTQEQAKAYAREWNIARWHGSYEALLDDPQIDVIYNSLPNHLHADWSIRALRAGKHVLCEKPIALSLEEMDAMIAAARDTGKVLAEAFMYRHHPQTLKVKELVDSGALGLVRLVRGSFTFSLAGDRDIRLVKQMGGGSIWDVGCYPISFTRAVLGSEPLEVFGWQVKGPTGIDETFTGEMRFAGDVPASFDCGFRSPLRWHMEIVGSDATLNVPSPFKPGYNEKLLLSRDDQTETIVVPGQELYIGEVEDMADAVLAGKAPRVSLKDSRGNTAAILALLESSEANRPIKM